MNVKLTDMGYMQLSDGLLRFLAATKLCIGFDFDDNYQENDVPSSANIISTVRLSCAMKKSMRSKTCSLIPPLGFDICSECTKLRRNWRAKSQKPTTVFNTGCNNRNLSRSELDHKLQYEKQMRCNAEAREQRLRKKLCSQMMDFSKEDNDDFHSMFNSINSSQVPPDLQLLFEEQKKQLSAKSPQGYRWHPKIIRLCISIYCKCPSVLDSIRQFIKLPSNRLLRYYKNSIPQKPGWQVDVIKWAQTEADRLKLKDENLYGGLILDEMSIQEDLQMVKEGNTWSLRGLVTLGEEHVNMQTVINGKEDVEVATHVLQFVFVGDGGFRFPVAHFPTKTCPPASLYWQFWEGVRMLRMADFRVYWCILDGGQENRSFLKLMFQGQDVYKQEFTTANIVTGEEMVFMVDCKHNFKKIRNQLEKSRPSGTRNLVNKGKQITWKNFNQAYNWDQQNHGMKLHERLTEAHFQLTGGSRMRNHLAEEVLDDKMLYLLKAYKAWLISTGANGSYLDGQIELLQHTSKVINVFHDSIPITSLADQRMGDLNKFLEYLSEWKASTTVGKQFFSDKLYFDLSAMILGLRSVVRIKKKLFPAAQIRPKVLNQDVCENVFCQVRAQNGQNDNPNYDKYCKTQNSILLRQTVLSKYGNTGGDASNSLAALPVPSPFSKKRCK